MVNDKIIKILCEQLEIDESIVTPEASLTSDLGAGSLDLVDISMAIEEEFHLEVSETSFDKFKTVGDIISFVEGNQDDGKKKKRFFH